MYMHDFKKYYLKALDIPDCDICGFLIFEIIRVIVVGH
jgi:hypothetical protein